MFNTSLTTGGNYNFLNAARGHPALVSGPYRMYIHEKQQVGQTKNNLPSSIAASRLKIARYANAKNDTDSICKVITMFHRICMCIKYNCIVTVIDLGTVIIQKYKSAKGSSCYRIGKF